jgi:hypothetical protein
MADFQTQTAPLLARLDVSTSPVRMAQFSGR